MGESDFEQKQAAYFRRNRRHYEEERPAFMQADEVGAPPSFEPSPMYGYQQQRQQQRDLKSMGAQLQAQLQQLQQQREAAAGRRQALLLEAEQLSQQLQNLQYEEQQIRQQVELCRQQLIQQQGAAQPAPAAYSPFASGGYQDPRATRLPEDFCPDDGTYELLTLHDQVPAEFIAEQLVDFKLYWQETGEARKGWQSRFRQHVVRRWKREQSEKQQRPNRSTVEKLTDRGWAQGFQFESGTDSEQE